MATRIIEAPGLPGSPAQWHLDARRRPPHLFPEPHMASLPAVTGHQAQLWQQHIPSRLRHLDYRSRLEIEALARELRRHSLRRQRHQHTPRQFQDDSLHPSFDHGPKPVTDRVDFRETNPSMEVDTAEFSEMPSFSTSTANSTRPTNDHSAHSHMALHADQLSRSFGNPARRPFSRHANANASIEVDPCDEDGLDEDEGYFEGSDDVPWLDSSQTELGEMKRIIRARRMLRFRSSAEAALECPKLIHSMPRMRRRRHKARCRQEPSATEDMPNSSSSDSGCR